MLTFYCILKGTDYSNNNGDSDNDRGSRDSRGSGDRRREEDSNKGLDGYQIGEVLNGVGGLLGGISALGNLFHGR